MENRSLTLLDLSQNRVTLEGLRELARALRLNATLATLRLENWQDTFDNEQVGRGDDAAKECKKHDLLDCVSPPILHAGGAIADLCTRPLFFMQAVQLLTSALAFNRGLTALSLSGTTLGPPGALNQVCSRCQREPERLCSGQWFEAYLSICAFGRLLASAPWCAPQVAQLLQSNSSLRSLDLGLPGAHRSTEVSWPGTKVSEPGMNGCRPTPRDGFRCLLGMKMKIKFRIKFLFNDHALLAAAPIRLPPLLHLGPTIAALLRCLRRWRAVSTRPCSTSTCR